MHNILQHLQEGPCCPIMLPSAPPASPADTRAARAATAAEFRMPWVGIMSSWRIGSNNSLGCSLMTEMMSSTSWKEGADMMPGSPDATTVPVLPENMMPARARSTWSPMGCGACSGPSTGCAWASAWSPTAMAARPNECGMHRYDSRRICSSQRFRQMRTGLVRISSPVSRTVVALEEVKTPSASRAARPRRRPGEATISSRVLSPKAAALDRRLPTADEVDSDRKLPSSAIPFSGTGL